MSDNPTIEPDYYVAETGEDTNNGTSSNPFKTISHAISTAVNAGSGKVIKIADGIYAENLVITGNITLIGNTGSQDKVIIKPSSANGTAISISADGTSLTVNGITLKTATGELSNPTQDSELKGRGCGISTGSYQSTITLSNIILDGFTYGISSYGETTLVLNNSIIKNTTYKGIYAQKLASADFTNVTFIKNATATTLLPDNDPNSRSGSAIDLNLVNACDHISFTGCTFNINGDPNGSTSGAIKIKIRGGTGETESQYSSPGSIIHGVSIANCIFTGNPRDVVLGTNVCPNSSDDFTVKYSGGSPIYEYNPGANAKNEIISAFYANGKPITISDDDTNTAITWIDGSRLYPIANAQSLVVFGGSKNANVSSSSIDMTGGTVACLYGGGYGNFSETSASVGTASIKLSEKSIVTATVFGGGFGYATVNKTTITISNATVTQDVVAGGANGPTVFDSNGIPTSVNTVTEAEINISGGTIGNSQTYGGVYGGGQSLAYVGTSEINISGGTVYLLCASGSNGITDTTTINIDKDAKITYLFSVNRGVINTSEINIESSFTGSIDKIALGALSDWDYNGQNYNQFTGGSTDGAVLKSVKLTVGCSGLKSAASEDTQVFLGRGIYSNYGNSVFTYDSKTYYQHYAYSPEDTLTNGTKITTPLAANVTVKGNVTVIAYVGNTTNAYDPTTHIIGTDKTWTFEDGAMISPKTVALTSEITTKIQNNGKLIFNDAGVGINGLFLDCGGNIEIIDTDFETIGLYIKNAKDVKIAECTFTDISQSPLTPLKMDELNAIYIFNCTGNITIGGDNKDDGNIISSSTTSGLIRGIFVINCGGGENSSLIIKNNSVSDVKFNAIQLAGLNFKSVSIINNTISNWDTDSGSNDQSTGFEGGRAIRMKLSSTIASDVTIENNVFIKSYVTDAEFKSSLSQSDITGYDDGNILKMTILSEVGTLDVANNTLVLENISNYYADYNMFKFVSGDNTVVDTYKVVIFNPNNGYFYTSLEPGVMCSIVTESSKVSKPSNPSKSSNTFDGWHTVATGGEKWDFTNDAISENTTLYTHWSYTAGSGTPITPPPVVPEPEPIIPDTNGNVTVPALDEKKTEELIHEAVSSGSDSITIIDTSDVKGDYTAVTVSKSDLETITKSIENNKNIDSVSIPTSEGNIIIEKEVLSSILENTDADSVSFEVEDAKNKLTEEQKKAVGDRPVYDINIKAGNENVTSFNGKTITVSLPYTLKAGEDAKNIVVYYVKDDGSLEKVNCTYKDGKVTFETNHLSKYVIGYEESDKPVTPDTPDDNKKESSNTIYYAVAAVIIILIIIALAYYFMKKKQ